MDPYVWFRWYVRYWLDRRSLDDKKQIAKWKKIVSRFKGKLVKMIKDATKDGRFDNYSISLKRYSWKWINIYVLQSKYFFLL